MSLRPGMTVAAAHEVLGSLLRDAVVVLVLEDPHGGVARAGLRGVGRGYSGIVDMGMGPAEVYLSGTVDPCVCGAQGHRPGLNVGTMPGCQNMEELELLRHRVHVLKGYAYAMRYRAHRNEGELPSLDEIPDVIDEELRAELTRLQDELRKAQRIATTHARPKGELP